MKPVIIFFLIWHSAYFYRMSQDTWDYEKANGVKLSIHVMDDASDQAIAYANKRKAQSVQILPMDKQNLVQEECILIWSEQVEQKNNQVKGMKK